MTFDMSCSLQVTQLLSQYLSTYELAPIFSEEEILHYLMPVDGVIDTHVVEGAGESVLRRHVQHLHPCVGISAHLYQIGMSASWCLLREEIFGCLMEAQASSVKSRHFCIHNMSTDMMSSEQKLIFACSVQMGS